MSIIVNDVSNTVKQFQLFITASSVNVNLIYQQSVPAKGTFVWNEKIVLHPTDKLTFGGAASANFDVHYTYIDQDWT